jgi:hypothetical protein
MMPADLTIIIPTNLEDLPTKTSLGATAYLSDRMINCTIIVPPPNVEVPIILFF